LFIEEGLKKMRRANLWKWLLTFALLIAAIWQLYPTYKLQTLSLKEKSQMSKEKLDKIHSKSIHLGLDLVGGMHLAMEVDKSKLSKEEAKDAVDRALEIIRNRVDQFGVTEPVIQKQGENRIIVELPGVDKERAKALIGRTALLEFKLLADPKLIQETLDKIDKKLALERGMKDTTFAESERPFTSGASFNGFDIIVSKESVSLVEEMLKTEAVNASLPAGYYFLWGKEEEREGQTVRILYLLKREPELTGAAIVDARMGLGSENNPNEPVVDFSLTRKMAGRFAAITGANIDKRLAIILDDVVQSAPTIRTRIPNGKGQIQMGNATVEEAKDLAIILRAGALPAPVYIVEERSVGPSLGLDSIQKGVRASLLGGIAVMLFILIYYSISGAVANFALVLNLLLLLAAMAGFRATLTLPGIAGIVLALAMAVDANVLIFERIREELRTGKTIRASIEAGYNRAFRTILDSNVTTFMAALALYWFGTGPIRGFAVTLSIGIAVSMFTAIIVTRLIFDFFTTKFNVQKLRI